MSDANHKSVILVLGMHRSGTSALTRVISLLGAGLCSDLLPHGPDNTSGFWESSSVLEANQKLLAATDSVWFDFSPLPPDAADRPSVAKAQRNLARVLDHELPTGRLAVLKDPRLCRLLPLVLPVLEQQGREVKTVLIHRHPWEVALSLNKRNGFDHDFSMLLWLRHVLDAEAHTRELPRAMCGYEELLSDWAAVVRRLGRDLGLTWPVELEQARSAVEEFLSPSMRHHHAGNQDAEQPATPLGHMAARVHGILQESGASFEGAPESVLAQARAELDQAASLCAPLILRQALESQAAIQQVQANIRELTADNQRLAEALAAQSRQLEHIMGSRIWRATQPLRLAAGWLKGRRQ
ncbi:MAG: sulfotransferase [Desulfarculaceae bacterium]|nr:sulfotransferase [Desulfarculaceae bacterium]MCF8047425.1 sulfotransferase [Desulfarculaceae bacterium]MCF8097031.1 sulfotransferase [Desulfarculaceae bacterium]MCF8122083.1 sulfotransferase [Desulfarculaceae bacterium]